MTRIAVLTTLVVSLLVPFISQAETAKLVVTSYVDYADDHQILDEPKQFLVDLKSVDTYSIQFYAFAYGEDEICFTGAAKEAAKIVDAILEVQTGDAFVYPQRAVITQDAINQKVDYEYEGGNRSFQISVKRCQ